MAAPDHEAVHRFATAIYDSENTARMAEHPEDEVHYLRKARAIMHHMKVLGLEVRDVTQ
jgi:hypothetical protein